MTSPDLILIHPPSVYRFRELPVFHGPVSDVIPSSSIFESYPIGFLTMSEYLVRHGIPVRIVNLALKMLRDPSFDPVKFTDNLAPRVFGIDLHWLPHVDGSLSLAEQLKRQHPNIPVILGGLSATYFHDEIMREYPYIDFILCGDSTEEPLRLLIHAIIDGSDLRNVPNLVWRDRGVVVNNGITFLPDNLDYVRFDYVHLFRMMLKYYDLVGYLPHESWLSKPVLPVFSCRGCFHNCSPCGGSSAAFKTTCTRKKPAFRSPELLAEDIACIARYTGAPIMVIGDLLQAGERYADRFLDIMRRQRIDNEIAFEFFTPPSQKFVEQLANSIDNFNVELSPESHDEQVRNAFGKSFDNQELESSLEALIQSRCKRIDLFFMVGLPYQTRASVTETVEYIGNLLEKYGSGGKILPMIAPLAPFVDPGSRIFESPEEMGYRLLYRTLREHRQAMLMPTWKQRLNYETIWMSRDEIVNATYDSAWSLLDLKVSYGLMTEGAADEIRHHIASARELIRKLDDNNVTNQKSADEIHLLNRSVSLCGKHELDWHVTGRKFHLLTILKTLIRRDNLSTNNEDLTTKEVKNYADL